MENISYAKGSISFIAPTCREVKSLLFLFKKYLDDTTYSTKISIFENEHIQNDKDLSDIINDFTDNHIDKLQKSDMANMKLMFKSKDFKNHCVLTANFKGLGRKNYRNTILTMKNHIIKNITKDDEKYLNNLGGDNIFILYICDEMLNYNKGKNDFKSDCKSVILQDFGADKI